MAKFYGSLVGALLQKQGFAGTSNFNKDGSDHTIVRDTVALTTGNVVGDQIQIGVMKSTAFISESSPIYWDALGAGVTLNVGDVNYPAGLAAALNVAAKGSANIWSTFGAAKMSQPLWQILGYPADPGGLIELLATIAGAAPSAAGSVAWRLTGINR